jgi:hypothetical protein
VWRADGEVVIVTAGALRKNISGSFDAFVTKLNPAGTAVVFSTYLGGNGSAATT